MFPGVKLSIRSFCFITRYIVFLCASVLVGVESEDQCVLSSEALSCFSGIMLSSHDSPCYLFDSSKNKSLNPLRAAVEKSGQCGTSSSHGGRENSTEKHQPVSEGISWEPRIVSSHTAPQKIAKKISFQMTENDTMVALQV